eukprot:Partr_v1_DN26444_c0_g1_i3_m24147 putative 26S proteasome nonATPase regulatory subunit
MVLEATVLVLDNSEWMRNGDYVPSRIEAQTDAVNLLFNAKTQSNPENTVGLMTMSGKSPQVLVTLTNDIGKILVALHTLKLSGMSSISLGIQVAQLMLKHRQNKNQRQRIVVFVGSPVVEDDKTLVKLAKKLKKNNVAVDLISFGEEQENAAKLQAFIEAVNSSDNSHLVTVPPGPHILSDMLLASPIVAGENGPPPGVGSSSSGFEFGVDPNLDPELALALRMSMEEERARQEATNPTPAKAGDAAGGAQPMIVEGSEDAMLAQALAMSMGGAAGGNGDVQMQDLTEEEQMARAIQMSVDGSASASNAANVDMNSVLGSLPGVDPNDPRFKNALSSDAGKKKAADDKKKEEPKK